MATIASEERKRPIDDTTAATASASVKRPHLDRSASSSSSSPASPFPSSTNGNYGVVKAEAAEDETNPAYKGLEAFRKEAIYRQMREAKRDLGRSESKIRRLEELIASFEEKAESFNRFWDTLVEDVRLLSRNDGALGDETSALMQAIPYTANVPAPSAFGLSLQQRSASIKAVLTRVVSLGPSSSPEVAELQGRCHTLAQESAVLRSQLTTAVSARDRIAHEVEEVTQELRRAEKRLDRLRSETVKATEKPSAKAEEEAEQAKVEAAEAEKKAALQRKQRAEGETGEAGEMPVAANGTLVGGPSSDEMEDLQRLTEMRANENEELRKEVVALRQESERLMNDLQRVPDQRILESHLYTEVHQLFTHAKDEHMRIRQLNERIEAENVDLRERRLTLEEALKSEANAQVEQLQGQIKAHEADVTRLRDQRDSLQAEVNEKRKREEVRFTQVDEMRALVGAKDTRIATLKSEVRRLQMTLAAKNGDSRMLDRLKAAANDGVLQKEEEDIEMIADLQARLKTAEDASEDLKRQLDARSSSTSDADLGAKVSSLQAELDRMQSIVGSASSGEDVSTLLKTQQSRIESMQQELDAAHAGTNALCDEVDKLGAAYSEMQRQANNKVLDVARMEDKMLRLTTEKSKADNKYFGAMRAKDAVENERRVALRNIETQLKVIERYAEHEASFVQSVARHEAEVTGMRKLLEQQATRIAELERDLEASIRRERTAGSEKANAEQVSLKRNEEWTDESRRRAEAEERVAKLERELERAKKQIAASGSKKKSGGGSSGDDIQIEYLNSLLRCSACKERYRDRIITRCLHTFCQACVDARIQTRQRKCPHCGLGFSTSDVQTLFLQ